MALYKCVYRLDIRLQNCLVSFFRTSHEIPLRDYRLIDFRQRQSPLNNSPKHAPNLTEIFESFVGDRFLPIPNLRHSVLRKLFVEKFDRIFVAFVSGKDNVHAQLPFLPHHFSGRPYRIGLDSKTTERNRRSRAFKQLQDDRAAYGASQLLAYWNRTLLRAPCGLPTHAAFLFFPPQPPALLVLRSPSFSWGIFAESARSIRPRTYVRETRTFRTRTLDPTLCV